MLVTYRMPKKSPYEGHVKVKRYGYRERMKALIEKGFDVNEKGEVSGISGNLKQTIMLMDMVADRIEEVKLTRKDTKYEITSLDDLEQDQDCQDVYTGLVTIVLQGAKLGES